MAGLLKEKTHDALAELPDTEDIRAELTRLRGEVETLLGKAASDGGARLRRLRGDATGRLGSLVEDGEALFGDVSRGMSRELRHAERRASATVRNRPVQAVAVALGVGFALALLLRR